MVGIVGEMKHLILQKYVERRCGVMPNLEQIMNMSNEEVVDLLFPNDKCDKCAYYNKCCNGECFNGIKERLESEVTE
jgi:hypothetical protein